MAARFTIFAFLAFYLTHLALSVDPPESSPSPEPAAHSPSIPAPSPSPDTGSPPESPGFSPPAPPPSSDLASPPHANASGDHEAPVPAPEGSDINHSNNVAAGDGADNSSPSSSGMSGAKKAGIAIGVIAAACAVGLGAFVYKKRQQNIRRSEYAYAARRELL